MQELIPVVQSTIGSEIIPTVNARDLHAFLGIGKDYSNWIKDQVSRARLVENRDFVVFAQKGVNPSGGRPTSEYHLSLRAGQHVGMMSNSDKGYEIRDYFIECERLAKTVPVLPTDPIQILKLTFDALTQVNSRVDEVQLSVTRMLDTVRLHQWQCYELKAAVTQKAQQFRDDHKCSYALLFPGIWNCVKREFRVSTYSAIPTVRFDEALALVKALTFGDMPDYVRESAGGAK